MHYRRRILLIKQLIHNYTVVYVYIYLIVTTLIYDFASALLLITFSPSSSPLYNNSPVIHIYVFIYLYLFIYWTVYSCEKTFQHPL